MTWNIEHGNDGGAEASQADFIVAQQPDLVILQEVNTPDHYLLYKQLLEQKTGKPWNARFRPHCQSDSSSNQVCNADDNDGVAILTPLTFLDPPDDVLLWGADEHTDARRAVRVKVRVGTRDVHVFGTHLAAGAPFEGVRISQINQLKEWMDDYTGPKILGGDLNAVPATSTSPASEPIRILSETFVDAWAALKGMEPGLTHNAKASLTRRLDYWFSEAGTGAQPVFVDRPLFPGAPLSDHYAVVAEYTFTPTGSDPLVGHWKLDDGTGSTTAMDSSGGGATGTLIGNPTWVGGRVGGALNFNGTTDLVRIPNQPSWNTGSSRYTVAFWVKVKQIENYAGAIAVGNWNTRMLEIMTVGGQWAFRINTVGGTNTWACEGTSLMLDYLMAPDDAFHHVALVLDAPSSRCFLYSDGQLVATDEYVDGTSSFGNQPLHIGGFGDANRLESIVDDLRLYNAALTQGQVQELLGGDAIAPAATMTAPAAGSTVSGTRTVSATATDNIAVIGVQFKLNDQNLGAEDTAAPYEVSWNTSSVSDGSYVLKAVARDAAGNIGTSPPITVTVDNPDPTGPAVVGHWKLDDGTGSSTALDSSGGGATGMLVSSPTWVAGQVGGALSFNGTTDLVRIPNQPSWNTGSNKYTVAFWVKVKQVENYAGAVAVGNWGTRMLEIMTTDGQWAFRINTVGGTNSWGCEGNSLTLPYLTAPDDAFHHVALVLDAPASRCFLYSDGQLVATDEYVDGTSSFGNQPLHIGGFGDANRLQSIIDDLRFYSTALTQGQVQTLMTGGQ